MAWRSVNHFSARFIAAALVSLIMATVMGQHGTQKAWGLVTTIEAGTSSAPESRLDRSNFDFAWAQSLNTYTASGEIIDASTGQPLSDIRLVYGQPRGDSDNGGFIKFAFANSGKLGEFKLANLKPGHYAIYVASSLNKSDLYSDPVTFDVADADVPDLRVLARHGSSLSGFLVPAGVTNPATFATLSSVKLLAAVPSIGNLRIGIVNFATMRPDGGFQIAGLRPGKAVINLKADGDLNGLSILRMERSGVEQKQGIDIKAGEDIADLRIYVADGTGIIRGRVEFEGAPLPEGTRMLASITNKLRFSNGYAQIDKEGNFAFLGIPAGTYEITLNTYHPPPRQALRLLPTLKQTIKVNDAAESQVQFTVRLGASRETQ
jgi:hypothetical protein